MISLPSRSVRTGIAVGMLIVLGNTLPQAASAASRCAPAATAQSDVVEVMRSMFAAMRVDDLKRFQEIATPDLYAYDGGVRFTGPASLVDLIKKLHATGKRYEWSVTQPEVHVARNVAWITYVNQGSVEDASGRQAVTWLESAVLEYANARWRIHFIHSTRAPKAT
jgi:ketosteroid isomerase-like protein